MERLASPSLPAVLQASDLGFSVYRRLGFEVVGPYDLWMKERNSK
jgi:hypothetical protein